MHIENIHNYDDVDKTPIIPPIEMTASLGLAF
jgi:hypothetical protein